MKRAIIGLLALLFAIAIGSATYGGDNNNSKPTRPSLEKVSEQANMKKIRIVFESAIVTGTLEGNATARDFASLLPLTVTLEDYNKTEKITDLPKRLSIDGAPEGFDPSVGDITYYAPWGNLAIFYRDFRYSSGLIKIGVIESGGSILSQVGPMQATIEIAGD